MDTITENRQAGAEIDNLAKETRHVPFSHCGPIGQRGPQYRPLWMLAREVDVRINELVRKSVCFLGIIGDNGDFAPYGTGFFVGLDQAGHRFFYLITAKHVLEDMRETGRTQAVRLNLVAGGSTIGDVSAIDWKYHATDEKCDVAVTAFSIWPEKFDFRATGLHDGDGFRSGLLTEKYIEDNDVGAGDEVYLAGLLTSHIGTERNIPIVRIGNIAAMPDEPIFLNDKFGHQRVYLIESRSIGGLSGSPVFLHTPPIRVVDTEPQFTTGHQREYLLGVLIGLFETTPHQDIISKYDKQAGALLAINAGIAIVMPIQVAIDIIAENPKLVSERDKIVKELEARSGFVPTSVSTPVEETLDQNLEDNVLRRMLSTPPKPHAPKKG